MPTRIVEVFFTAAMVLALAGPAVAGATNEVRVVATIKPLHSLVAAVMQGVGAPHLLVDGARSPHDYRLRPSDARALNKADVIFRVSPQLETFLTRTTQSLPSTVELVTLINLNSIAVFSKRTGLSFESHEHHEEHERHENDHHARKRQDAHVWLSPSNGRLMTKHIASVLAKRWPAHATTFENNAERLIVQIEAINKDIGAQMEKLAASRFVVFHDAFQYFERSFGLRATGAISIRPDTPPGAKRLLAIRRSIRDLKVQCVFSEPQFRARVIDTVIEGMDVGKGVLDPVGAKLTPGPKLYVQLMQNLATGFEDCLGKAR
ncbi:MAG: zinc ABC transporter substrate-binding protein [Hyphomicrobiaceae bacterium]